MPIRAIKPLWLLLMVALLIGATDGLAQRPEIVEGWEKFADASPFPTDSITVPSWRLASGPHVRAAFREIVADPSRATVRVSADGKRTAYGGIVRSDGWIVTKASQLSGKIVCRLADGRQLEARVGAVDRENDVALLKIEASNLPVLEFTEAKAPPIGAWLASVGIDRDPVAVGVMSVESREIAHRAGILGVRLGENPNQAVVVQVFPKTGASRAGLKAEDVILSINGQQTPTRKRLISEVGEYSPGDQIEVEFRRDGKTHVLKAILTGRFPHFPTSREEFQNHLGGDLSQRRFGFPDAFQHDTVVKPTDCGGPVVNLAGEVVGMNIARAGRTETYAIPTSTLAGLIEKLLAK